MNKHKNKKEVKNTKKSSEIQEQEGRDRTTTIRTFRVVDCFLCRANTIHDVIFTFILLIVMVNVCKYTIHGCYALGVPNTHQPAPLTFQEIAWLTRVRELREQVGEPETLPVSCVGFEDRIPPGELTYPTKLEKEHHFPIIFGWDILVPRRVWFVQQSQIECSNKTLKFQHFKIDGSSN